MKNLNLIKISAPYSLRGFNCLKNSFKQLTLKKISLFIAMLFCFIVSRSQNNVLIYEPFDTIISSPIPLTGFNASNEIGLSGPWYVQNGNTTIPGFNVTDVTPLAYGKLQTLGSYATGGNAYLGDNVPLSGKTGGIDHLQPDRL